MKAAGLALAGRPELIDERPHFNGGAAKRCGARDHLPRRFTKFPERCKLLFQRSCWRNAAGHCGRGSIRHCQQVELLWRGGHHLFGAFVGLFPLQGLDHAGVAHVHPAAFDFHSRDGMALGHQRVQGVGEFVFAAGRFL